MADLPTSCLGSVCIPNDHPIRDRTRNRLCERKMMNETATYEFAETYDPPKSRTKGGPGRPRQNPFDAPLLESYRQGFWQQTEDHPQGRWYEVPDELLKDGAKKAMGQIRNAGQYLKRQYPEISSQVRVDEETGRMTFRGAPKPGNPRPSQSTSPETVNDNASDVNEEGYYMPEQREPID